MFHLSGWEQLGTFLSGFYAPAALKNMEQETKPSVAGSQDFPAKSSDSEAIEARFTDLCKVAILTLFASYFSIFSPSYPQFQLLVQGVGSVVFLLKRFLGFRTDDGVESQNALSLEEEDFAEATKLFIETKHILSSNVSAIGNGTVVYLNVLRTIYLR